MKKISIIIATYHAAETLQTCLDSIRPQKDAAIELLVIDGNSTDSTLDIIKANADLIDYYVHEKDNGIYDAWNKGIKASHGEWILFLGADDLLCPQTLSRYMDYLSTQEKGFVEYISGRVRYVDEEGKRFKISGKAWNWEEFAKEMKVAHVASLHRRSLFNEVGLFDPRYKICGDYELLMRKENRLKTAFIDEVFADMRMGGASLSKKAIREACVISNLHTKRNRLSRFFFRSNKYAHYYLFLLRIKINRLFR